MKTGFWEKSKKKYCSFSARCETISGKDYKCHCPAGFHGTNCDQEIDACYGHPCLNNAVCKVCTLNTNTLSSCYFIVFYKGSKHQIIYVGWSKSSSVDWKIETFRKVNNKLKRV